MYDVRARQSWPNVLFVAACGLQEIARPVSKICVHMWIYIYIYLYIYTHTYTYLSVSIYIYLFLLSVYLLIYLSMYLAMSYLSVCLSIYVGAQLMPLKAWKYNCDVLWHTCKVHTCAENVEPTLHVQI